MFQFESLRPKRPDIAADALDSLPEPAAKAQALLAWTEHCVECAAPSCYATCDLYDPTPLGKCRRFDNGILAIARPGKPPLAEVRFKRWGKLEAQGNATPLPVERARTTERLIGWAAKPVHRLGLAVSKLTGDTRWATVGETLHKKLNDRLQRRGKDGPLPNAFIADIYNPAAKPVKLILTVNVDQARLTRAIPIEQQPRPFRSALDVQPGPNRFTLPTSEFQAILGSGLPFLLGLTVDGDETAHLAFGRLDLVWLPEAPVAAAEAPAKARPNAKCVVFDLDNTLWKGVLLEGAVEIRQEVAELFRRLDERGILISISSKNAADDAFAQLKRFGLDDYLLHPQIGWDAKSEGLRKIAAALDIGIDTFIFVDDNPFERAEVSQTLPMVEVLPDTAISTLLDHPRLQGAVTPESKQRRQMYKEAAAREVAAQSFDDFAAFLKSCDIRVTIRPDRPSDFDRIAELVQRTNQLNFSGRKYGRDEIAEILRDKDRERFVVEVSDKFGSYGTVGFCLANWSGDALVIEDFMLSCRVQGKFIEQALFWYLSEGAGHAPVARVVVNFKRTDRNAAAHKVLTTLGFEPDGDGFSRAIAPGQFKVDFLAVNGDAGQDIAA
ncbi:HAD-IIIC family phosphatase [Sphingomonas sp. ID1715]|uniref:HAD-IIIC family phosphatase n=1 Tax=Sphingomonas sp. ID1715 TaxID=1656898 RepID=UPI0014884886|nr:HAD-IIIC family phosphatase [Sphingomonas sp. ID1715]NNM77241.1 HAD-IIIC family phosphatase [Sphingomonas sp. ID1715]